MLNLDHEERATVECVRRATDAYIECALWSSTDDDGTPLDQSGATLAPEARETMAQDVYDFLRGVWDDGIDLSALEPEQIGHDFWLTRNRHGAGFWDRGLGELGDTLTDIAHAYGECDLYIGDDGLIYTT